MTLVKRSVSHLMQGGRKARKPAESERVYPWRFRMGQDVYVLSMKDGIRQPGSGELMTVVGGELHNGCPHLHVYDAWGAVWRVPQLQCSPTPVGRDR